MEVNPKYIEEALRKGYEIVEHVDKNVYKYKRIECGHIVSVETANMRHQKRTICRQCDQIKYENQFKIKGLTLVKENPPTKPDLFVIDSCGHTAEIFRANLFKSNDKYKCQVCYKEKYNKTLDEKGIELVEHNARVSRYSRPSKVAKFRYKHCGHEFTYVRHAVDTISDCPICYKQKVTETYLSNGLELVQETSQAKAVYKFIECGHERELYKSAAIRGNCICHVCNNTAWSKPSKIYILKFETNSGFKFIKFGYGKNINNRLREYRTNNLTLLNILFDFDTQSGYSAMLVEKSIHKDFAKDSLENSEMKQYFANTGYSECYPVSMCSTLIEETQKRYLELSEEDKVYIKHEKEECSPQKVRVVVNRRKLYNSLLESNELFSSNYGAYGLKSWIDSGFVGMVKDGYLFEQYDPEIHTDVSYDYEVSQIDRLKVPINKSIIGDNGKTYLSSGDFSIERKGFLDDAVSGFVSKNIKLGKPSYGVMFTLGTIEDSNKEIVRRVLEKE